MTHDAASPYNAVNHEGQSADDTIAHTAAIAEAVSQSASAMQSVLIAIATANSSAPTDGQAIVFQASTGNLIWGSGGTSSAGKPIGLLLALTKAA